MFFRTTYFLFTCFVWQCIMLRNFPSFHFNVVLLLSTSATESLVDKVAIFGTCDNSTDNPFLYFLYSCRIFWLQLAFVIYNKIKQKHSSVIQLFFFISLTLPCCYSIFEAGRKQTIIARRTNPWYNMFNVQYKSKYNWPHFNVYNAINTLFSWKLYKEKLCFGIISFKLSRIYLI